MVEHVGALADLLEGQLLALGRVGEGLDGGAGVVDQDLDVLALGFVDVVDARLVAGLELLDQLDLLAANEADRVALGLEGGGRTDHEGPLVLLEQQAGQVLALGAERVEDVDPGKLHVGVLLGRLDDVGGERKADPEEQLVTVASQGVEDLLAVGAVLVRREVLYLDLVAELLLGLVEPSRSRVVERLVATAGRVEHQPDLLGLAARTGAARAASLVVATTAGGDDQAERHQQGANPHTPYPTHSLLLSNLGVPPAGQRRGRAIAAPVAPAGPGPAAGSPYLTIPLDREYPRGIQVR